MTIWISKLDDDAIARESSQADGPMAGWRLAVKDNVDVVGFPTTAACPSFAYEPSTSAVAISRLVEAGAVVVGKTNLDQFATGLVGTRSPYGAVANPVRPGFVSGGSSSGSAAAVALGEAEIGIATDTAGSGRVPAAFCGLVGLKGTRGWVPTSGVVPACPSFDCTTVLARTLQEAASALRTMAGPDRSDPSSRTRPPGGTPPVQRIGFLGDDALLVCDQSTRSAYDVALQHAAACNFEMVEVDLHAFFEAGRLLYEGAFVAERHAAVGEFVAQGSDDLDPSVSSIIGAAARLSASDYAHDRRRLEELTLDAGRVWDEVDAVLMPTAPFHPTLAEVEADPIGVNLAMGTFVSGVNLVDWCAAAFPLPSDAAEAFPVGLQLLGKAWTDEAIWQAAARLTGEPLDRPTLPGEVEVAVVGAHLEGEPLNHQLTGRGATLVQRTSTAPAYRMVVLDGAIPKPGMMRDAAVGAAFEVEVWRIDHLGFGQFVAEIPAPLGIGTVELADGSSVLSFLCEAEPTAGARDISTFGGWRNWLASGRSTE